MTQQFVYDNPNYKYKRRLFYSTGYEFIEVSAKFIEPYSPPAPTIKSTEIKVINAPSHFQNLGIASYKCSLTLLFPDKKSYADYLQFVGWTQKFYDERGNIYLGSVESVKATAREGNTKYVVDVTMCLVKKDRMDKKLDIYFQDIKKTDWYYNDLIDLAELGLIQLISYDGSPVLYFKPSDTITRAEFITFLNRTRRLLEKILRE